MHASRSGRINGDGTFSTDDGTCSSGDGTGSDADDGLANGDGTFDKDAAVGTLAPPSSCPGGGLRSPRLCKRLPALLDQGWD